MIGAILVAVFVAVMSSVCATLCNILIGRKFPGVGWTCDPNLPEALFIRLTCYRLAARLFYYQAIAFWVLLGILVCIAFL